MKVNKVCSHCNTTANNIYNEVQAGRDTFAVCGECYAVKNCYECGNELEGEELRAPMGDRNGILCDCCHKEMYPDTGYYEG